VTLDAETARRIGVTYATAELRSLEHEVRGIGNVTYDERRLTDVSPKIEGWVERLYVDFTGAPVRRGQPLLEVYSPMLISAQEELILAVRLAREAATAGSERAARTADDLLDSARRRLRYWDILESEIEEIERAGSPRRTLTVTAPASGVVVEKNVTQGTRIMPGMNLYRIADLARVWIEVEVFEKDLSLIRLGQHGVVLFEPYPYENFEGLVTYVYPTVSVDARTARVRLELANPGGRIKPGMYATVLLHLPAPREALVVPRSAVLQTGERALVFVREANGTLAPREVRVGLVVGNDLEIAVGLEAGEVVVSSANFLIDAESNMGASVDAMLDMGGGAPPPAASAGAPAVPASPAAPAHDGD
jgi:Cu(I)/Ag(I) efflux system membrane fusion protein